MKKIITIGRQFGSGGHAIGESLANELGYAFFDKEVLQEAAKKLHIPQTVLEQNSESSIDSFLYNAILNNRAQSFEDRLAKQEFEYLKKQAAKKPCVIIGRCGGHLFRNDPSNFNVYITAPMEKRVERILSLHEKYGEVGTPEEAKKLIVRTDKKRANYFNYYTDCKWNDISLYHMVMDSSIFGVEETAHILAEVIRRTGD